MKHVVNPHAALLCNYEVFQLVRPDSPAHGATGGDAAAVPSATRREPAADFEDLRSVQYHLYHYFMAGQPCAVQTAEQVAAFMRESAAWAITKAERLQLLNARPKNMVELHTMIEECEERFTDEQRETMLRVILTTLAEPVTPQPADAAAPQDAAAAKAHAAAAATAATLP